MTQPREDGLLSKEVSVVPQGALYATGKRELLSSADRTYRNRVVLTPRLTALQSAFLRVQTRLGLSLSTACFWVFPLIPVWMFNKKDLPVSSYECVQIGSSPEQVFRTVLVLLRILIFGVVILLCLLFLCGFANSRVAEPYPRTVFNFGNITKIF